MAAAPGEVLFQPGARCQATPPLFRGTPVISRLNRVISQQSTNELDNRPRFLALICRAAAGRREKKRRGRERARPEPNGTWPKTHVLSLYFHHGGFRIQVAF